MTETPEKTAYYACYTVTRCCSHWSRPLLVTSSNACVHLASLLRSRSCVCRAAVIGNLLLFCTKPAAQVWQHHVTMTTGRIATLFYNFVWVYAAGQWQRCPHQEMLEVAALTCKGFPVCLQALDSRTLFFWFATCCIFICSSARTFPVSLTEHFQPFALHFLDFDAKSCSLFWRSSQSRVARLISQSLIWIFSLLLSWWLHPGFIMRLLSKGKCAFRSQQRSWRATTTTSSSPSAPGSWMIR